MAGTRGAQLGDGRGVAQALASFSGQAFSPAGDKGRFALPPAFRNPIKDANEGSRILCLDKHPRFKCLVGFGPDRRDDLQAQLDREADRADRHDRDFDYDARSQQLFGFEMLPFDDSGRFVMPGFLIDLAEIEDGLFFRGSGRFFTVWNPRELFRMGDDWETAKAACRSLMDQAASKGKGK